MARQLSFEEKGTIIGIYKCGKTYREIQRITKRSLDTISKTIRKYKQNIPCTRKYGSGCPRLLNEEDFKKINKERIEDPNFNCVKYAKALKEENGKNVTPETIRNTLKQRGFKAFPPTKRPHLTKKHKERRMEICQRWNMLPSTYWNHFIFSDECKCSFGTVAFHPARK
ncbi:uncharacterized protein LOC115230841 [Octopus sinensis]|uniref:Uncharacterized protein LOC115230841 n=1 Tax=Octopus sinensis TaxID=2607531 RepID=A0A6P7U769_9MOLL|nr:uncharacterized protein LOC115230841 [Octopus sinensis]